MSERAKELRKASNKRAYQKRKQRREGFQPTEKDYVEKRKIEAERTINPFAVDGYISEFRPSQRESGYGENKNGGFLICSRCGQPLDKNGKCPVHGYGLE